jgi:lysyl-tRNA synthetase class 2
MDKENLSGEKALIEERRKKLEQLRDKGDAYGNSFKPKNNASKIHEEYGVFSKENG